MIIDMHTHIIDEKNYKDYKKKNRGKISKMITLQSWEENSKELMEFIQTKKDLFLVSYFDVEGNEKKQLIEIEKLFKKK